MITYKIDYNKNYIISFLSPDSNEIDPEDFRNAVNFLKSLWVTWDIEKKHWFVKEDKIEEVLGWMDWYEYNYLFTEKCETQLKQYFDITYKKELVVNRAMSFDNSILNEGVKLFNYQVEGLNWRIKRNVYLDAYDAGTGKTILNICTVGNLFKKELIDGILIIVPNGLPYHWQKEILTFINLFSEEDILLIDNSNKWRPFTNSKDKKIIIIPDHLFASVILSYKDGYKFGQSAKRLRWKEFVNLNQEWNKKSICLLIDESHSFKSSESIKSKALDTVRNNFNYRYLLSATPAINKVEDIYNQLSILDRSIIPMSENSFKLWLADSIGNKWDRYNINKYNANKVSELRESYRFAMTQKLKSDIPEMKVKQIIKQLYIELPPAQKQLYELVAQEQIDRLEEEYFKITSSKINNVLPHICEAIDNPLLLKKKKSDNPIINNILKSWSIKNDSKFNLLSSKLSYYIGELDEKVIVWDYHPETLDLLAEMFKKYNPLVIHGSLNVKDKQIDRNDKVERFNEKDDNKLFLLSSLTSSAGLNLQKKCHRSIIYTMPWDATLFRQLQDRTHRITSSEDTIVEIFTVDKSIDVIRCNRNLNRVAYNDRLNKVLSKIELRNLLIGIE